jgi:hypothetical protein
LRRVCSLVKRSVNVAVVRHHEFGSQPFEAIAIHFQSNHFLLDLGQLPFEARSVSGCLFGGGYLLLVAMPPLTRRRIHRRGPRLRQRLHRSDAEGQPPPHPTVHCCRMQPTPQPGRRKPECPLAFSSAPPFAAEQLQYRGYSLPDSASPERKWLQSGCSRRFGPLGGGLGIVTWQRLGPGGDGRHARFESCRAHRPFPYFRRAAVPVRYSRRPFFLESLRNSATSSE